MVNYKGTLEEEMTQVSMKRVELKRVLEILGKKNSEDEKTPFAGRGSLPNNGSFSKDSLNEDDIKKSKEFLENDEERLQGPMSITRKFCFVMSFNCWIIYFLALGWLIPCRNLDCNLPYSNVVETNLSDIWLLTNIETVNIDRLPSFAMIGYGDGPEVKLSAFETYDAAFVWNNSLPFIPKKIQCNFENIFDANADGTPDCLLLGFNDLYAFNVSNGFVFWHQSIPSEEGNILSGFQPSTNHDSETVLIGTCGDKLVTVNAQNGSKVSETSLPCQAPFDIKIVPNKINDSHITWSLICDYGDQIEAWNFREDDVLKTAKDGNVSDFSLLFSGANSGGSIDLGCDVTPIPGGPLLLSWADRVVMVTQESTAWERYFPEPLTVASIKVGYFKKAEEMLIATAVRNSTDTVIYIMEPENGTIVDFISIQDRQVQSMEKISDHFDLLVLKSRSLDQTSDTMLNITNNITDPIPSEKTNFALIDYSSGKLAVKDILTTSIVSGSAINMQRNGETDLLLIKTENGFTSYLKYILHDVISKDNVICLGGSKHGHHYSLEA